MLTSRIHLADLTKGNSNEYLVKLAKEQIKTIDTLIQVANKDGKDRVEYDLPSVIDVGTMSQADAQLILFSTIIKAYDVNNFNIVLSKGGKLSIKWSNNLSQNERDELKNYLKQFIN